MRQKLINKNRSTSIHDIGGVAGGFLRLKIKQEDRESRSGCIKTRWLSDRTTRCEKFIILIERGMLFYALYTVYTSVCLSTSKVFSIENHC